jgi:DNA polymerase-3 subunit epsilon
MLITGLDFEATSVDPETARILEVGAALYDTDAHAPVELISNLVYGSDYPSTLDPEVISITGITQEQLEKYGVDPCYAFDNLTDLMEKSVYVMAHNGNIYDHLLWLAEIRRQNETRTSRNWTPEYGCVVPELTWIDTTVDLPFPKGLSPYRKLTHLAADHDFLNPFKHRAVFDVLTMIKIFECYPLEEVLALARQPMVQLQAFVSYEEKDKAKGVGYRWFKNSKRWIKAFKLGKLESELQLAAESGFQVKQLSTWAPEEK